MTTIRLLGLKEDPEAKKRFIPGVNIAHGRGLRYAGEAERRNGRCLLKGTCASLLSLERVTVAVSSRILRQLLSYRTSESGMHMYCL